MSLPPKGPAFATDFTIMQALRQSRRGIPALASGKCPQTVLALFGFSLLSIPPCSSAAIASNPEIPDSALRDAQLPVGFKIDRYTGVWQRNPFILATPTAPTVKESPFSKMFMTSWLKDGPQEVIYVQNSDTNAVQKITEQPNQNNLRLIEFRSNSDPKLVEAVISDGKEKGVVKFRFEAQTSAAQAFSPETLARSGAPTRNSPLQPGLQTPPLAVTTSPGVQSIPNGGSQQVQRPLNQPPGFKPAPGSLGQAGSQPIPGSSDSRRQIAPKRAPHRRESEGVRLPDP